MIALQKRLALLLVTSAALPVIPALAADYDPPVAVEQADEYVPVEVGSGWYLRGDVGYTFEKGFRNLDRDLSASFPDDDDLGPVFLSSGEEDEAHIGGSIGFGYHFNDYLRADINIGVLPREKFDSGDSLGANASINSDNTYWNGLLNGYVDLGTFAGVTPYVGAGIGVLYSKAKVDAAVTCAGDALTQAFCDGLPLGSTVTNDETQRSYDLLYAANAGFSYQIARNTSLDVGYQYMIAPDVKYVKVDDDGLSFGKGLDSHTIKVGLRYDLW